MSFELNERRLRIVIGDPSPMISHGLTRICELDPRLHVVSHHLTIQGVKRAVATERANLVLLDWNLVNWKEQGGADNLDAIYEVCPVVFLAMTEHVTDHKQALQIGAKGVLSKRSSPAQVRKAIWKVANGGIWIEPAVAESLLEHSFSPKNSNDDEARRIALVTRRERQVLGLICKGYRNKQIAAEMKISEITVSHHLTSIFGKLKVNDRLDLLSFAYRHSLHLSSIVEVKPVRNASIVIPHNVPPVSQTAMRMGREITAPFIVRT